MTEERNVSRSRSANVRYATPADVDGMMKLGVLAAEENGVGDTNIRKLLEIVWRGVTRQKAIAGVIEGPDGMIEAATLLLVEEQGHSRDPVLVEQTVYVHPDFRSARGGRAAKLVEFNKGIADKMGIPLLIGILSNDRTAAKIRLYERMLGKPSGAYWLYGGRTGQSTEAAE